MLVFGSVFTRDDAFYLALKIHPLSSTCSFGFLMNEYLVCRIMNSLVAQHLQSLLTMVTHSMQVLTMLLGHSLILVDLDVLIKFPDEYTMIQWLRVTTMNPYFPLFIFLLSIEPLSCSFLLLSSQKSWKHTYDILEKKDRLGCRDKVVASLYFQDG